MGCRKTVDDRGLKNPILTTSFLPLVEWLDGGDWNMFIFPNWEWSSQFTNSYFSEGLKSPTRWKSVEVNHFITVCCFLTCSFFFFLFPCSDLSAFLIQQTSSGPCFTSKLFVTLPGIHLEIEAEAPFRETATAMQSLWSPTTTVLRRSDFGVCENLMIHTYIRMYVRTDVT